MVTGTFRDRDRTLQAERHVSWVRFGVILFNIVVYYTLITPSGIPVLAAIISVVAGLYAVVVVVLRPYLIFGAMRSSLWTAGTDAVLIVLWITATGGAASPFFVLWTVSLVAIGYRYGPRPTIHATMMYLLLDAVFLAAAGALATPLGVVRLGYILFIGALMAFVSGYTVIGMRKQEHLEEAMHSMEAAKTDADEAHSRLRAVLDNAPSTIFEVDLDGRITYINRVAEGFEEEQILGQAAGAFIADGSKEVFETALRRTIQARAPQAIEVQGYGPNREIREYRTHLGPLTDGFGNVRGAIAITLDVTEEKQQKAMAEESENHRRHAVRLQEEAELRGRFINTAAHELNTPMTPLRLQMGILRNVLGESHTERRAVDIMERNLVRLGSLVTDLLDATRLQEGQLRLKPTKFSLSAVLDDAMETFGRVAEDRGIALEVAIAPDATAYADPERVGQIIYNLLSNALKFTPSGGRLQCEGRTTADGTVELSFTDTGPGFTDEEIARLFLPFSQVHPSLVTEEPGTGLGLYLSRDLAKAQGGSLNVSSPGHGKGATFTLTLPCDVNNEEE